MRAIQLTDEAANAIKYKGPTPTQLVKMLVSNDEKDMPSSRHARWMAHYLLASIGYEFLPPVKKPRKR